MKRTTFTQIRWSYGSILRDGASIPEILKLHGYLQLRLA